ncbi:MAG: acyl--CoA ligase [Acidisphaera sp.]|nr:acyl--CoA ligase [Acidisphaera sp.]
MFDRFITFRARQQPHAVAVSGMRGDISYQRFEADIDRFAAGLAALEPSGLVAVQLADPYLHCLALLAFARLGVPTASYAAGHDRLMLPLLRPELVIADAPGPEPRDAAPMPRIVPISTDWVEQTLRCPPVPLPRPTLDPDGLARVVTSSGSTGVPKKLAMSWRRIERTALRIVFLNAASHALSRLMSAIGVESGAFSVALSAWAIGGAVLFGPQDPAQLAAALPRLSPRGLVMAPIQLRMLLDVLPPGFLPMPELWIGVSGSHTPRAVRQAARARLTPNLLVVYASTEGGATAEAHAAHLEGDDAAVGWVLPWATVQIVDRDGRVLPTGELGQIRVRGEEVVEAYLDDADATARQFRDGWFYPGDLGRFGEDGMLRVEGRVDDVMNFGGEKLLPRTIEDAALACAGVLDAGAFVMPDAAGISTPWIAVVRGEGFAEPALAQALRLPGLPPVYVAWVDRIPRNALGKVQRDMLQQAATKLKGGA